MSIQEIFIVLIINSNYVRWETITPAFTMNDLNNMLITKYLVPEYYVEIGNRQINKFTDIKVFDIMVAERTYNQDYVSTFRIFTKANNYILPKEIE